MLVDPVYSYPLAEVVRLVQEQPEGVSFVEALIDHDLPNGPVALKIQFGSESICLLARGEDDTISVSRDWPSEYDDVMAGVFRPDALGDLLRGARLKWAWLMQNNLGYTDGVQLEFKRGRDNEFLCIQFIVIGSTLELRVVGSPQSRGRWAGPEAS